MRPATQRVVRSVRRIRADLESRGVAADYSERVARRLIAIAGDLSPREYAAALDGVAAAHGAASEAPARGGDVEEIRRLMRGFAGELRKLDEGLRVLSAYLVRMHGRATGKVNKSLH